MIKEKQEKEFGGKLVSNNLDKPRDFKHPEDLKEELKQEFFNRLAEELDKIYPKGEKKLKGETPRSRALVFNYFANAIFRDIIDKL